MKVEGGARVFRDEIRLLRSRRHLAAAGLDALKRLLAAAAETADWADFRRAGDAVKLTMLAAVGALSDAGGMGHDHVRFGILGGNGAGCGGENAHFWSDYVENERMGRGGLFVGTLNSIPVCEAAIALGAHGAAGYVSGDDWEQAAAAFLRGNRLSRLLLVETGPARADALLLAPSETSLRSGGGEFGNFCDRINEVMLWSK